MSQDEAAKKAIYELDRAEYDGKTINIKEARPKGDRQGGRSNGNKGNFRNNRRRY